MEEKYLTVTALNRYIKYKFQYDNNLKNILLSGEISNFKRHSRGHFYFTLKDENSQISAIMFKSSAIKVLFNPKDGDKVYIKGDVSTYEQGGTYQVYVNSMKLSGIGDLYLKFEKLKKELQEAGLFNDSYKKPLPKYPSVIGVITSPTGAAIHDIITTTQRRYPIAKIILYPALVQGEFAKDSIVKQIKKANSDNLCDVLIVGRGGGSLEDLWAFNEKVVALAIFDSKIPVISAVGHEVDFSISDFVADKRAATPTAGAEVATPNVLEIKDYIKQINLQSYKALNNYFEDKKRLLSQIDLRLDSQNPINKLKNVRNNLDIYNKNLSLYFSNIINVNKTKVTNFSNRLNPDMDNIIKVKTMKYNLLIEKLKALNPLNIMDKGFSIVKLDNKLVRSYKDIKKDDRIDLEFKDGKAYCKVMEVKENGR